MGRFGIGIGRRSLPIGIDIGASGAKLVQLARTARGLRLGRLGRVELPADDAGADDDTRLDSLLRAIGRRVGQGRFRGRQCVVSIDDRMLRTRAIRQPRMSWAEIDNAVRLDAPQRLGFGEHEACEVGWIRAGEVHQAEDVREEVLYVGALRQPLEHIAMGLSAYGLRPLAIEPGFLGLTRCFGRRLQRADDREVVRLLVDIGYRSTSVLLTRGADVAFYKLLELGGADLTRVAAERLGLGEESVNDLRRRRMSAAEGEETVDRRVDRALFDAVRPLLGDLGHEVNLCLRHYSVTFRGSRPTECIVVGGEACEPRLVEALGDALQLRTSVGKPFEDVLVADEALRLVQSEAAAFGVAAGLSMRPLCQLSGGVVGDTKRVRESHLAASGETRRGQELRRAA